MSPGMKKDCCTFRFVVGGEGGGLFSNAFSFPFPPCGQPTTNTLLCISEGKKRSFTVSNNLEKKALLNIPKM
jgi:hypothetical protein